MQVGSELPEMHNTSCELHNVYDDVVKGKYIGVRDESKTGRINKN